MRPGLDAPVLEGLRYCYGGGRVAVPRSHCSPRIRHPRGRKHTWCDEDNKGQSVDYRRRRRGEGVSVSSHLIVQYLKVGNSTNNSTFGVP